MYVQNADGTRTPVQVQTLTDVRVSVCVKGGAEVSGYTVSRDAFNNILLDFPQGIGAQVYSVEIAALLGGRTIRTYFSEAFEGVEYNRETTYENFITGSRINLPDSVFVLSADTAGIEEITRQLQQAIAATEAERAEYERKLHELDGVAQQGNDPNATNTAIYNKMDSLLDDYAADIREIIGDWTNE